ncbi:unnamed protein product, partial [Closterium sp. Naga37s-1]
PPLSSERGVRQGDPLGPLLFAAGIHPALREIAATHPKVLCLAYADDVTFMGEQENTVAAFTFFTDKLAHLGLAHNPEKCAAWSSATVVTTQLPPGVPLSKEGVRLLGSYLGPATGAANFLAGQLEEMAKPLPLLERADPQVASLLLTRCISRRRPVSHATHLMRHSGPLVQHGTLTGLGTGVAPSFSSGAAGPEPDEPLDKWVARTLTGRSRGAGGYLMTRSPPETALGEDRVGQMKVVTEAAEAATSGGAATGWEVEGELAAETAASSGGDSASHRATGPAVMLLPEIHGRVEEQERATEATEVTGPAPQAQTVVMTDAAVGADIGPVEGGAMVGAGSAKTPAATVGADTQGCDQVAGDTRGRGNGVAAHATHGIAGRSSAPSQRRGGPVQGLSRATRDPSWAGFCKDRRHNRSCINCHLWGQAAGETKGKSVSDRRGF